MRQDELNTILAALRTYQELGYGTPALRPDRINDIACPTIDDTSLDDAAIDELCERLNCAPAEEANVPDEIARRIEDFAAQCTAAQYTDTGEAWQLLQDIYVAHGGDFAGIIGNSENTTTEDS